MKPRVFVRLDWKELTNDKRSSLLRKTVIYGQKSFITLGPGHFQSRKMFVNALSHLKFGEE